MKAQLVAAVFVIGLLNACSSTPTRTDNSAAQNSAPVPSKGKTRVVKSRDGSYTGEMVGTPAAGSKFAQLEIGMQREDVHKIMGHLPDERHSYESGKRWIPYYFGNDARRVQALYRGEGCLIFTGGGQFSSGGDLIQIEVDPTGVCYAP